VLQRTPFTEIVELTIVKQKPMHMWMCRCCSGASHFHEALVFNFADQDDVKWSCGHPNLHMLLKEVINTTKIIGSFVFVEIIGTVYGRTLPFHILTLSWKQPIQPAFSQMYLFFFFFLHIEWWRTVAEIVPGLHSICKGLVSKETVLLRRWGRQTQNFGFISWVDKVNWPP